MYKIGKHENKKRLYLVEVNVKTYMCKQQGTKTLGAKGCKEEKSP